MVTCSCKGRLLSVHKTKNILGAGPGQGESGQWCSHASKTIRQGRWSFDGKEALDGCALHGIAACKLLCHEGSEGQSRTGSPLGTPCIKHKSPKGICNRLTGCVRHAASPGFACGAINKVETVLDPPWGCTVTVADIHAHAVHCGCRAFKKLAPVAAMKIDNVAKVKRRFTKVGNLHTGGDVMKDVPVAKMAGAKVLVEFMRCETNVLGRCGHRLFQGRH